MKGFLCFVASVLALAPGVRAASPSVEAFTSGLGDWFGVGAPAWQATNGYAQTSIGPSLVPVTATLSVTGGLSGAAFTGDYTAQTIGLIGFRFRAESVLPQSLRIRILSGADGYTRFLQSSVQSTGTWFAFFISLESKAAGTWDGSPESQFPDVLANVTNVSIDVIAPTTLSPAMFRVDDILIDRLHAAAGVAAGGAGEALVSADDLQSNSVYALDVSTNLLDGAWARVATFTATNRFTTTTATNAGPAAFFRIVLP